MARSLQNDGYLGLWLAAPPPLMEALGNGAATSGSDAA